MIATRRLGRSSGAVLGAVDTHREAFTMRWLSFAVLALIALVGQSTLAARTTSWGVRPDFLIVLVVFFALYAPAWHAVLAGWVLGILADLLTIERLGLLSLTYGTTALLILSVREYVFRYLTLTQAITTFLAVLFVQGAWGLYRVYVYEETGATVLGGAGGTVASAAVTAVIALAVFRPLLAASRLLGIPRRRYSFSATVDDLEATSG